MKKRILVWIMILCMVASLIPVIATADNDATKYVGIRGGGAYSTGGAVYSIEDGSPLRSSTTKLYVTDKASYDAYISGASTSLVADVAYCFNQSYYWPATGTLYDKLSNVTHDQFTAAASKERDAANLDKWIISICMNGYPIDYSGFNKDENGNQIVPDDSFLLLTQKAIWYYSDSDDYSTKTDFQKLTDKEQAIFNKLISTKLSDNIISEARAVLDLYMWDSTSSPYKLEYTGDTHTSYQNLLAINTAAVRSLTLTKEAVNGNGNDEFTFTINVTPESGNSADYWINETDGTVVSNNNGKIQVKLKNEQSITIEFFGSSFSYSIEESDAEFASGVVYTPSIKINSGTGTTDEVNTRKVSAQNVTADTDIVYVNTGNDTDSELKISKTVVDDISASTGGEKYSFKVTLTDSEGKPFTEDIKATEKGEDSEILREHNGEVTFELGKDDYIVLDLPIGVSYKVEEINVPANVESTISGLDSGTIVEGKDVDVTFTNTYIKTGTLTVSKTVTGDNAPETDFTFEIALAKDNVAYTTDVYAVKGEETLTLTNDGGTVSFTLKDKESITLTLPAGVEYIVEEVNVPDNFTSSATGNSGTITEDETATAEFTNTYSEEPVVTPEPENGKLTVSKTVTGDGAPETDFTFEVELVDNGEAYTTDVTATQNGVEKTLTPTADGKVTFTLKHGESIELTLPAGIKYQVEEINEPENFKASATGESGTISATEPATAAFINTYTAPVPKTGTLTVSKTVVDESKTYTGNDTFDFTITLKNADDSAYTGSVMDGEKALENTTGTITISLKAGESKTLTIQEGVTYEVTEAASDKFTTTSINSTGTISADTHIRAVFTNTYKAPTGTLTVSKKVEGEDAPTDAEFTFTVTLICADNSAYTGAVMDGETAMTNKNGTVTFTLKAGESKTLTIPAGITYAVTETEVANFTTEKTGDTGTISATEPATAAFTNTYTAPKVDTEEPIYGNLKVSKKVEGDGAPSDAVFTFVVTLTKDDAPYTTAVVVEDEEEPLTPNANGEVEFTLKAGESKTLIELPDGVKYSITEKAMPENFSAKTTIPVTGTIEAGDEKTEEITNTYTKPVEPSPTPSDDVTPSPTPSDEVTPSPTPSDDTTPEPTEEVTPSTEPSEEPSEEPTTTETPEPSTTVTTDTPYVPYIVVTTPKPSDTPTESDVPEATTPVSDEPTETSEEDVPDETPAPETPEPTAPVVTAKPTGDTNTTQTTAEKLPQTGTDWLPVWVLLLAGALLLTVGIVMDRRRTNVNVRRGGKHKK